MAPVDDPRSADELLEEIRRIIEAGPDEDPSPELPPEPLLPAADHARTIHLRRQLTRAAEHGAALLASLGLPRLVGPDHIVVDPVAAGDALDLAIATLDALDGDTDVEDGGDEEPSLGWIDGRPQFCGDYQDRELDTADAEPSLASPERHPEVWGGNLGLAYTSRGPDSSQLRWADGSRQDTETDIADERHDGDGEDLEAEPNEPILGATEHIDQTGWADSGTHDREFDATDCIDRHKPRAHMEASLARRGEMAALRQRAQALRFGSPMRRDPDEVTPIRPSMVSWGGPSICTVSPVAMPAGFTR